MKLELAAVTALRNPGWFRVTAALDGAMRCNVRASCVGVRSEFADKKRERRDNKVMSTV